MLGAGPVCTVHTITLLISVLLSLYYVILIWGFQELITLHFALRRYVYE